MDFPIDLKHYRALKFDLAQEELTPDQEGQLQENIRLVRDSIIFFTALANTKGLGGHTGGAFDMVPEVLIADGFMKSNASIYPVFFDEAGHRVALQYIMAVLNGFMPIEKLLHYREFGSGLYGHPERDDRNGIFFSSGRLGHLWSYVNGVACANPDKIIILYGSDGSQQEGGDAEAARYAVSRKLNIKLIIDDNDITIAGRPSHYMPGFDLEKTLQGHGLNVDSGDGENLGQLFQRIRKALTTTGPVALINKRKMAIGVGGIEDSPKGHDVIPVDLAVSYLKAKNRTSAWQMLENPPSKEKTETYLGSSAETAKNRDDFGKIICDILKDLPERKEKVLVVDSDLEGSCGLHHIRKAFPEIYINGGIMERNNFSVAAGFGCNDGRQGIYGTFSAFLEMVISEITMARLNHANVLAHFSHAGVDDMADNTCHFGINNLFADNGLPENDQTRLYFPADARQMRAILTSIFHEKGLRFVFSTRSATPFILKENGKPFFDADYQFNPDRDEIIRNGRDGFIVSYGEMLYRCLDVVERLRDENIEVGLINKPCLNRVDEDMLQKTGASPFVLVVESQNIKTGLGSRFGTWLLERGYAPRFSRLGSLRDGNGGLSEQIPYQGLARTDIIQKVKEMLG